MTQRTQGLTATVITVLCCCSLVVASLYATADSNEVTKAERAAQAQSLKQTNPAAPIHREDRSVQQANVFPKGGEKQLSKKPASLSNVGNTQPKAPFTGHPTPPNEDVIRQGGDDIASATVISSIPYFDAGSTSGYTDDYNEVCPYTADGSADVVYSYTPGSDIVVDIDLCPSGYDTKVYVYENAAGNTIACNDDADACVLDYRSQLLGVPLTSGNTYYIVVDGYGGDDGSYDLSITENSPCIIECPVNHVDEGEACGDTINDGCNVLDPVYGEVKNGDSICGTAWADGDFRDTDWYLKTFEGDTSVTWCATAAFDFAIIVARIDGCGDGEITVVESAGGLPCDTACITATLGAGTYVFFIAPSVYEGYPCDNGPWNYVAWLNCSEPPPGPSNNNCADATPIGDVVDYVFTNVDATTDGPIACTDFGYSQIDSDVWFCYTASCDGVATASLCGSDYDTKMAVYDGCSCPVSEVDMIACNEDFCDLQSQVVFPVTSGNTYLIRVGGYEGDQGNGVLNISCGSPAQDDECVDVTPQTLPAVFSGDNTNATNDCDALAPDAETWAAFTTTECSNVTIEYCGTAPSFETIYIVIFEGCPCGSETFATSYDFVSCGDDNATMTFENLPAGTYYHPILASAADGALGPYTVTITSTPCGSSYCSASGGCDEYISRVAVGDIDNSSACDGYADYTAYSTSMDIGVGYPITVENGNGYSSDQCGIWVDWNQDLDFTGPDEAITGITGVPGIGPYSATITPPAGAVPGPTRMRVRITYTGALGPCGTTTYGEVEDYTINVAGGEIGADLTVEPDTVLYAMTQSIDPIYVVLRLGNEFAPGYDANDINQSTVLVNGHAPSSMTVLGAYAGFDGPALEILMDPAVFIPDYLPGAGYETVTATVTGDMNDTAPFSTESETFVFFAHAVGDLNMDGTVNVVDLNYFVAYMFLGGQPPAEMALADINGDGVINVIDLNYMVAYFFLGGNPPVQDRNNH